jgi:DNA-binding response OmpR family regulator
MRQVILVVEDDPHIAHLVELHLRDLGYQVEHARDGAEALRLLSARSYDLLILDLMLPEMDGLELCRRVRSGPSYVPILMLTAKSTEVDRVVGLELGADDYLTKPFSIRELQARVKALFRRIQALKISSEAPQPSVRSGGLFIEVETINRWSSPPRSSIC